MCEFFSLVSDGKGKPMYFDWELRKKILSGELKYEADSHTSIADYYGFKGEKEDVLNKYEYNPLLKKFRVDQINTKNDSARIEQFCRELDFKTIISPFLVKDIIHPFKLPKPMVSDVDKMLLKEWDSVRASVWASVGASVGDSVWALVRASVWASVWASNWAYTGSFFTLDKWKPIKHKNGKYPFQPLVDLWEIGLVPSFDGTTWRLHGGEQAEILFKITKKDLEAM